MFQVIYIFVLTALVCNSNRMIQPLLLELVGELLTTILTPYNILQGVAILPYYLLSINSIQSLRHG